MGKGWKTASKMEAASKKGLIFTKLAREIQVSAKSGGADPAMNSRLRIAIDAAKKVSCPNDTIERAIKKGAGLLEGQAAIEEVTYEGYGPHGVGVIVECQTDNRHRTAPEIRSCFKKNDGAMGEQGAVGWMFARVGLIVGTKAGTFDPEEEAIEAGANEVEQDENEYSFYTALEDLSAVRTVLEQRGWKVTTAEPSFKATNITELTPDQLKDVESFLNALDDLDDTHRVYATLK